VKRFARWSPSPPALLGQSPPPSLESSRLLKAAICSRRDGRTSGEAALLFKDGAGRGLTCDSFPDWGVKVGGMDGCRGRASGETGRETAATSGGGKALGRFGVPELSEVVTGPGTFPGPLASAVTWEMFWLFTGLVALGAFG